MEPCTEPQFLWLRYKGVLAPWDFEAQPKYLGFKCKKYARWKEVHFDADSPQVLRQVGDSLIDEGSFPLAHYEHIARVWERIQRWARDKTNLALEPTPTPAFEEVSRLARFGSEQPSLVDGYLADHVDVANVQPGERWALFTAMCTMKLLQSRKSLKGVVEVPDLTGDFTVFVKDAQSVLAELYKRLGRRVSNKTPPLTQQLLKDLGLPHEPKNEVREEVATFSKLPQAIIEYVERSDNRIAEPILIQGSLVIKVNKKHPACSETHPAHAVVTSEFFWRAVALACLDHLAKLEDLQDFLDSLGSRLTSEGRMHKIRRR
jgi:hypothetical protein